jgi:hypothetical protein
MAYVAYCLDPIVVGDVAGVDSPTVPQCLSGWVTAVYVPPFDPSQVDIAVCLSMIAAGISLYATPWAISYGAGLILNFLRGR